MRYSYVLCRFRQDTQMFLRAAGATDGSEQQRSSLVEKQSGVLTQQGSCSSAAQCRSDIYSAAMETVQSSTGGQGSLWRIDR